MDLLERMDQDRWTKKLHKPFVMNCFPEGEALKITASYLMTHVYSYPIEHRFSSKFLKNYLTLEYKHIKSRNNINFK